LTPFGLERATVPFEASGARPSTAPPATRDRSLALTHLIDALSPADRTQLRRMLRRPSGAA
jgi:hypothetical protein